MAGSLHSDIQIRTKEKDAYLRRSLDALSTLGLYRRPPAKVSCRWLRISHAEKLAHILSKICTLIFGVTEVDSRPMMV